MQVVHGELVLQLALEGQGAWVLWCLCLLVATLSGSSEQAVVAYLSPLEEELERSRGPACAVSWQVAHEAVDH